MRVTEQLIANSVTANFFTNTRRLFAAQKLVGSGKRINKPSDDPAGMGKVLDYRRVLSSVEQYTRNINKARSHLALTESVLGSVDTLLIGAKEIASQQSTGTASPQTRTIAADKIRGIRDQVLQLANTKSGNTYLFSGHKTDSAPFPTLGNPDYEYQGDAGKIRIVIGEQREITINAVGGDVFTGEVNLFQVLQDLEDALRNNDAEGVAAQTDRVSAALNQVLNARAGAGEKLNLLETTENYWAWFKLNTEGMLVEIEDADITKAITDLTTLESAYQASLAATAKIIQPSLIDFLR